MATYDPKSMEAGAFINHEEILETLAEARTRALDPVLVRTILDKAAGFGGLSHREAAILLEVKSPEVLAEIFALARRVKEHIYGRRIVMFAPLYLSDFCVNRCSYCGYNHDNPMKRRKLDNGQLEA
jgi:2-iminoacetate synthase